MALGQQQFFNALSPRPIHPIELRSPLATAASFLRTLPPRKEPCQVTDASGSRCWNLERRLALRANSFAPRLCVGRAKPMHHDASKSHFRSSCAPQGVNY
jgi:hypothetical protein